MWGCVVLRRVALCFVANKMIRCWLPFGSHMLGTVLLWRVFCDLLFGASGGGGTLGTSLTEQTWSKVKDSKAAFRETKDGVELVVGLVGSSPSGRRSRVNAANRPCRIRDRWGTFGKVAAERAASEFEASHSRGLESGTRPGHHTAAGFTRFWDSGVQNWFMRRSWGHLGCIRASIGHSIRRRCRGITHLGRPLGRLWAPGPPESLRNPFQSDFLEGILN